MLLSHSKKFIFLKTNKTASTSIEALLERFCLPPDAETPLHARPMTVTEFGVVGARMQPNNQVSKFYSHMPATSVRDLIDKATWEGYLKVSSIRDPYDKVISAYYYRRSRSGHNPQAEDVIETQRDFRSFVQMSMLPNDRAVYCIDEHVVADFFIRYESLYTDLKTLVSLLDLPLSLKELPSYKKGIRSNFAKVDILYDRETAEIVEDFYAFEFDYFGYPRLF